MDEEISAVKAAQFLGTSLNHTYTLLRVGKLRGRMVDGRWFVLASAVRERLQRRQKNQETPGTSRQLKLSTAKVKAAHTSRNNNDAAAARA